MSIADRVARNMLSGRDPRSEYDATMTRIERAMARLHRALKYIRKGMDKQLDDNPGSWSGIGRGSELDDLAAQMEETAALAESFAKAYNR